MTEKRLFGTDGIRGHIDSPAFQRNNVLRLGHVIGKVIINRQHDEELAIAQNCTVVIGRDTRASGLYLEQTLIEGITTQGVDCELVGILPTSAVAHFTKKSGAALGIMISASHNRFHDNGFKLFDPLGFKISERLEALIEEQYALKSHTENSKGGVVRTKSNMHVDYGQAIAKCISRTGKAKRLRVVIDCAHGSASSLVPEMFAEQDVDVTVIGANPDGGNINLGFGSEHPETLKQEVIKQNADLGIAFDGDADRVVFVDDHGQAIDGDAVLAVMARDLQKTGRLAKNTLVATVMSSAALDHALISENITVLRTEVGDKFVVRKMKDEGYTFGGENSGHLILFPEVTTGDGIFSSILFLDILQRAQMPASSLINFYKPMPKLLRNIEVTNKIPLEHMPNTQNLIASANHWLKSLGRVLMRYSGTENKVRLLVEAPSAEECHRIANSISAEFLREKDQHR